MLQVEEITTASIVTKKNLILDQLYNIKQNEYWMMAKNTFSKTEMLVC